MFGGVSRTVGAAIGAATLLCSLAFASSASACSCAPMNADSVARADAAAVMRLDDVDVHPIEGSTGYGPADYTYTVREVLAGGRRLDRGQTVEIRSHTSSAACGLRGEEDRNYGLLLFRHKGKWQASLCSTTSPKRLRRLAKEAGQEDSRSTAGPSGCR